MGSPIFVLLSTRSGPMSQTCVTDHNFPRPSRDPVCGIIVRVDNATPSSTYLGLTYHFRTPECREKFEADPGRYVAQLAHRRFRLWLWS
jgi:YHS domain-containing protein